MSVSSRIARVMWRLCLKNKTKGSLKFNLMYNYHMVLEISFYPRDVRAMLSHRFVYEYVL